MGVVVVTGANSGIGRATTLHLAAQGHTVYGTVRDLERADKLTAMAEAAGVKIHPVELDVAENDSVRSGFARILEDANSIDVLVNNAGIAGNAVVEECPPELFLGVFNVDLCGAVRCIQAVLPGMRARRSGTIVNVTSIIGRFAHIAQAPYVAAKWAFEGVSEELAQEVAPFGIRVAIIEPGVTKSAIFAKNVDAPNSSGAYDDQYRRMFQFYATGRAAAIDPNEVAVVIERAINTDQPRLRYTVSWGAAELMAARPAVSDEDVVALGAAPSDDAYYDGFQATYGLDIR